MTLYGWSEILYCVSFLLVACVCINVDAEISLVGTINEKFSQLEMLQSFDFISGYALSKKNVKLNFGIYKKTVFVFGLAFFTRVAHF